MAGGMAEHRDGFFPFRVAWLIPVVALITLGLGFWGWSSRHLPVDESLYRAIALFDIDSNTYSQGEPLADWRFRVGRWTGLSVVFSGIMALAVLLHEHLATAIARWTKQAVVVVGEGPLAGAAYEIARRRRASALWLGASAFGAASYNTIALAWPPTDRPRAVFDHAKDSDHVLIACENDAEALAFARAARASSPRASITVLMRDVRLAEDAAATLNEPRTRVLSTAAVAARSLTINDPPFLIAKELGHQRIHALIIGFGQTGQAIARDLIVNCRTTYLALPRITVIDPEAKALEGVLRVRAPELDACAETLFIEGEIGGRAVRPDPKDIARAVAEAGPITAAYVCLAADADGLSAAAMLQSLLRAVDLKSPPIFVRLREENTVSKDEDNRGLDMLNPFGDLESVLEASEFLAKAPDAPARDFNEAYRAALKPEQRDDPANHSAYPWERLDETYRQVNRDVVAHVPAKLASAGVDPARWRGVTGVPKLAPGERLYATPAELEVLAELEHERWMASRRMDGWRSSSKRDNARRLHPDLVAYAALTDEKREYDRVYVRQTEAACSAKGGG